MALPGVTTPGFYPLRCSDQQTWEFGALQVREQALPVPLCLPALARVFYTCWYLQEHSDDSHIVSFSLEYGLLLFVVASCSRRDVGLFVVRCMAAFFLSDSRF